MINNQRNSNLELFRIVTMFFIVAHHYVVNSGLIECLYKDISSIKSILLFIYGAWGKTGINCFVLITGYFMCESKITLNKFLKLLLEVMFYRVVIYLIFLITGYTHFNIIDLGKTIIPIYEISYDFTSCYLLFYLSIPFINILVHRLNEKQHVYLLLWCLFTYVMLGTLPKFHVTMNYVTWFIVLYLIASYIKLYPKKIYSSIKVWGYSSLLFICLSIVSVVLLCFIDKNPYRFVTDSNTFLAVGGGLSLFMFFNNLEIKNNKVINTIASTTFGVLLIHANSDTMRQWLWKDTLNNVGAYYTNYTYLHATLSVLIVFIVCSLIDLIRIKYIETSFFIWLEPKLEIIESKYKEVETIIANKINMIINK